jgi:uncharacterized membrane protein (DUF2068 family)
MSRPLSGYDWDTRSCGLHGHVTYAPDEPELADALTATTAQGHAWRCLRCGVFVPGPAHGKGPASSAPIVLRGRALRDAFILRLLAAERLLRGLLLIALAYGLWRFEGSRDSLQRTFDSYLPALRALADQAGVDLTQTGPVRLLQSAFAAKQSTLTLLTLGVLGYAALQLTEAVGLALMRRWGEYLAVVATSVFLPLEVYELTEQVTVVRVLALAVNLLAVGYLLWTKRLFGLRGGRAAYQKDRANQSLIEVIAAAE